MSLDLKKGCLGEYQPVTNFCINSNSFPTSRPEMLKWMCDMYEGEHVRYAAASQLLTTILAEGVQNRPELCDQIAEAGDFTSIQLLRTGVCDKCLFCKCGLTSPCLCIVHLSRSSLSSMVYLAYTKSLNSGYIFWPQ